MRGGMGRGIGTATRMPPVWHGDNGDGSSPLDSMGRGQGRGHGARGNTRRTYTNLS